MIANLAGFVWKKLPRSVRAKIIRVTQPKFTVSAAAVITNEKGEVLLLDHVIRPNKSGWGLPGGFINYGEQPEDGIRREIREETGIELNDLRLFQIRTLGTRLELIYSAEAVGEPRVLSREISDLGWFEPAKMNRLQKALVEKVLKARV
jgi:8-oxo-dGTP diphosphatase